MQLQVIFGTADTLRAVVVTANSGFVRAAEHRHVTVAAIVHESRALTERKQVRATSSIDDVRKDTKTQVLV